MKDYLVEWSINISAESKEDAVLQAWGIVNDPESVAAGFRVTNKYSGDSEFIDAVEIQGQDLCG
jgi:hypothetical protein